MLIGIYPPRYTVKLDMTFKDAIFGLNFRRIRYPPVIEEDGRYMGLLRLQNIIEKTYEYYEKNTFAELQNIKALELSDNTVPPVTLMKPSIDELIDLMTSHKVGALAVVNKNEEVIGEITEKNLIDTIDIRKPFGILIGDIISGKEIIKVEATDILISAVELMRKHKVKRLPVVFQGELIGIITIRDVLKYFALQLRSYGSIREDSLKVPIWSISTPKPITIGIDDDIVKAIELFKTEDVGSLIVVDENYNLRGMLTEIDILRHYDLLSKN
ncbi:CBS domain-containing protein [Fervidicoccus fontis]|nr:CBS domain-containing protein [Fervidicoccus fontis]MBE9390612.1 CBS domain-containing protein [Fervidicoccus fontis]